MAIDIYAILRSLRVKFSKIVIIMILPEEKEEGGKGNVKLVKSICIELEKKKGEICKSQVILKIILYIILKVKGNNTAKILSTLLYSFVLMQNFLIREFQNNLAV